MVTNQYSVGRSSSLRLKFARVEKESGLTEEHVIGESFWSSSKLIKVDGIHNSIAVADLDMPLAQFDLDSINSHLQPHALERVAYGRGLYSRKNLPCKRSMRPMSRS